MRPRVLVAGGLLGFVAWACASEPPPRGPDREVTIQVSCVDEQVSFTVSPWRLELNEGEGAVWTLADATQTIEIQKKQRAWPFSDNKLAGSRADPPHGRAMKGGQKGKSFRYAIAVTCEGSAGAREIVIDPEMYVRR